MADYVEYLKELAKEQSQIGNLKEELEKRKKRILEIKELWKKIDIDKKEFIETCRNEKKSNYELYLSGVKKCLICDYTCNTNINSNLYNHCPNCKSHSWLVGKPYPCELCNRIVQNPHIHHIDGNRENNIYENFIFICQDCHTAIHYGIGRKSNNLGKIRHSYSNDVQQLIKFYASKLKEKKSDENLEV